MSSYRKKRNSTKPIKPKPEQMTQPDPEYTNPGVERSIHTDRLTSGLPYQRPVNPKEVDRLIREWDERLLDPITVSFRDGKWIIRKTQEGKFSFKLYASNGGIMLESSKEWITS